MRSVFTVKKNPRGFQKKPLFVVVGKRVAAKAVDRNRLKRRMRVAGRQLPKGSDYTIIASPGALNLSFKDVVSQIVYTKPHG